MANQPKKYKKFVATAATATLVASAIVPVASADTIKFSDVKDDSEFAPFIYDLAEQGVMTGAGGKFNPTGEVTRNAAVKTLGKWLVNVHNYEIPEDYKTKQRFSDIPVTYKDEELLKYAALVKDLGVFSGAAGKLNPTGTLTREQMAKVVVEAYSVVENRKVVDLVKDFESSLTDIDKVAKDLVDYVKVFEKYEVTTVKTFNPKGKIQRQHFAKFLSLAIGSEDLAADTAELPEIDGPGTEPEPQPIDPREIEKEITDAVFALRAVEVTTANVAEVKAQLDAVTAKVAEAEKLIPTLPGLTDEDKATFQAKLDLAKTVLAGVQAKVDALLPGSVAEEVAAVTAAVAALPSVDAVTTADTVKVEAVEAAVAALEKAIAEAKNLPAADKAAAEKAVTEAKAAAAAVKAAIEKLAPVEGPAVASVSAINGSTQVLVTFAKDAAVTEADLTGKKVTLTAGEATLTGTYLAESLSEGTAVFVLDNEAELKDAVEYTVTGDFTTSTVKFVAVVGEAYAKTLEFVTTGITAQTYVAADADANPAIVESGVTSVSLSAKDQYGKEYTLSAEDAITATVKINGVPQATSVVEVEGGTVLIKKTLTEGQTVEVTVTNTVGKEKYTATQTYTVAKAATPVPTTISNLTAKDAEGKKVESLVVDNVVTFAVEVRDQNNNKVTGNVVTWVVNGEAVEGQTGLEYTHTVDKAGELVVEAFLANGKKVSFKSIVSAQALETLSVADFGTINNNEKVSKEITFNPSGATLKPEEVTTEVTSVPTGVSASDVKVTVAYGTTEATKNQIFATVTTPVNGDGTYKVKFSAAGKTVEKTIVSEANKVVASITVDAITANELQAGGTVYKAITFKNKHGELVKVTEGITEVATAGLTSEGDANVTYYGADAKGERQVDFATSGIKFVGITANENATGEQSVTLVKDTGTATVKGEVVAAGKIKTVTLESAAASAIKNDSYDAEKIAKAEKAADKVAVVTEGEGEDATTKAYTLIAVSAVDSYGKARELTLADFNTDAQAPTGVEYKYFTGLENDDVAEDTTDVVKYIGVHVTSAAGTSVQVSPLLKAGVAVDGFTAPKKTITVKADRKLSTLKVEPTAGNILVNGTATFKVTGLDQHGGVSALASDLKVVETPGFEVLEEGGITYANGVATIKVKGSAEGTHTVTIFKGEGDTPASTDVKATATLKVQELENAIKSIELTDVVKKGDTKLSAANLLQVSNETSFDLTPVLKDGNGQEVDTNNTNVIYSVENAEIKVGNVVAATVEATSTGIKVTKKEGYTGDFTGTVEVTATTTTGKTDTITLNVSNAQAVAQAGTFYFTSTASGLGENDVVLPAITGTVAIKEDKKATTGSRSIFLVGKDQYSQVIEVVIGQATALNGNVKAEVAKTEADTPVNTNELVLTAVKAGATTVNVFVGGKIVQTITVSATEADVTAATPAE